MLLFGIKLSNYLSKCALKLRADVARGVNNRVQQPILTRACVTRMLCCVACMYVWVCLCVQWCVATFAAIFVATVVVVVVDCLFCQAKQLHWHWIPVLTTLTRTHTHSHSLSLSPSELRVERSLSLSKQRFHWDSLLQLNKYLSTLKMTRCLPRLVSSTQLHHSLTSAIDIDIEMSIELQIIKDNAPRIIVAFYSRLYGCFLWPFALRLIAIYS